MFRLFHNVPKLRSEREHRQSNSLMWRNDFHGEYQGGKCKSQSSESQKSKERCGSSFQKTRTVESHLDWQHGSTRRGRLMNTAQRWEGKRELLWYKGVFNEERKNMSSVYMGWNIGRERGIWRGCCVMDYSLQLQEIFSICLYSFWVFFGTCCVWGRNGNLMLSWKTDHSMWMSYIKFY